MKKKPPKQNMKSNKEYGNIGIFRPNISTFAGSAAALDHLDAMFT